MCPPSTRAWIVQQLRNIGKNTGVQQALYLADGLLRRESGVEFLLDDRDRQMSAVEW